MRKLLFSNVKTEAKEQNEDIKHKYFRVSLRNNETIKQVLDGLQFTLPFEYKIYDKNITIK